VLDVLWQADGLAPPPFPYRTLRKGEETSLRKRERPERFAGDSDVP
jgi:hypothetical protein